MDNLDLNTSIDSSEKQWYIATTYTGQEQKVAQNLRNTVENQGLQDKIFRIIVAEEKEMLFDDKGQPIMKKNKTTGKEEQKFKIHNLYGGYIFVEMIMTDDTWYIVRNTMGVTGIIGSSGGGQKPVPVSSAEMEDILKRMGVFDSNMFDKYNVGDQIKVVHGTFKDTEGTIKSIDRESGKVVIEAIFFGKRTPIEVDFSEITRV